MGKLVGSPPGLAAYKDVGSSLSADVLPDVLQPSLQNPKVRYRDLAVDDPVLRGRLLEAIDRVLRDGRLLMGPAVEQWERKLADYCGAQQGIGVSSGTNALYLALKAFDIGPGDEVIMPAMTWVATANAVAVCGATPVFVDVGDNLNIDPSCVEAAITPRTRAIMPVHYTGLLCDMDAINEIARRHCLVVIEDAAQAYGAEDGRGRRAGSFGDAAAYSLNPMKVFPGYGEVGVVLLKDAAVADRIRALRYLGTVNKEVCVEPSLNHKVDTIQAAMMLVGFDYVEPALNRRTAIAKRYCEGLNGVVDCPDSPASTSDRRSVYFDFTIKVENRPKVKAHLESKGIEVKIRHPLLMSDHPAYAHLKTGPLPKARSLVKRILSLPIHEKLSDEQVDYVIDSIIELRK